ncbi:11042_t:CDS:2, partial [Funneliformis geosporum]
MSEQNSMQFLVIWINRSNSQTYVKNQIQKDINNFAAVMKPKPLTDKQIAYIVNAVFCPLLEYRLQCTPLSERECNVYFCFIRTLFKRKSDFAITIPTAILNNNKYYNLQDFWSLQVKLFTTALLNQFNSTDLYYKAASASDIDKLNEYQTTIAEKLSEYDLQDIYNCPVIGTKKSKNRVTILLTCNATGEDKLKPLFIYKYKNPRPLHDDEIVETVRPNPNADDLQDEEEIIPVIFLTEALINIENLINLHNFSLENFE